MGICNQVEGLRKPTVAGVPPGYRMDAANMCDSIIACENAVFGSTQVKYAMNGFYHGVLSKVNSQRALRAQNMDHLGATTYELRVTQDLLQRGLFTQRINEGLQLLKAGNSRATERPARG